MPRIAGIDIPENKKTKIGLTSIYGIGRNNVFQILKKARVNSEKKVKDLSQDEIAHIQKAIENISTEGILRKEINDNIKRLKQIGSYVGARHAAKLPARGQRTRHNARTKRGKRMTVGALKKDMMQKLEASSKKKAVEKGKKE